MTDTPLAPAALKTIDAFVNAKHLLWLREKIGDRFAAGAVLHTGPDAFELDERVLAVPISAFWA